MVSNGLQAAASPAIIARAQPTPTLTVAWVQRNPGPAAQNAPQTAYDPLRDELLLVWEDGRNDPLGVVDSYGIQYNSDIYARRYNAATGQAIAEEIAIAEDGEYPPGSGRYDNEQRPAVIFDAGGDRYVVSWQTFPDSVLASGDLHVTTCNDVDLRSFHPADGSLGEVIEDLAWYTSPPDLISPWGVYYDWSCQQDPVMTLLAPNTPLVLWHDHRERYERGPDGVVLEKDIYGQWLAGEERQVEEGFLVSRRDAASEIRLPRYQEHADVAGEGAQRLVVWEDERNSDASDGHGFREIVGRFIDFEDGALRAGKEIFIAHGQEGDGPEDYRLLTPRVAYLADKGVYVIVWAKAMHYADPQSVTYSLVMAMIDREGDMVQQPTPLADTCNHRMPVHDIACAAGRCVLAFRKQDLILYARLIIPQGAVSTDVRLEEAAGVYGYADIQPGAIRGDEASFFVSYVKGSEVHLARLDTVLPTWATPTPSPTLTPTPTPPSCGDAYEPDDAWEQASPFPLTTASQRRSFHQPGDVDFVRFSATRGETFAFTTNDLAPGVDTILTLLGPDGVSPMILNDDDPFHSPASRILWRASQSGEYFLKVVQVDATGGCDMAYTLTIDRIPPDDSALLYLPLLIPRPASAD